MTSSKEVSQGDIWWVNFDPTIGQEIQKIRPAIVIDSEGFGYDGMRIVIPFSSVKEYKRTYCKSLMAHWNRWLQVFGAKRKVFSQCSSNQILFFGAFSKENRQIQ